MNSIRPTLLFKIVLGILLASFACTAGAQEEGKLVGYWNFDRDLKDASGNQLNGTKIGGDWTQGMLGEALLFDGSGDQMEIPHHDLLNLKTYTISMWARSDEGKMYSTLIRKGLDERENYKMASKFGGRVAGNMQQDTKKRHVLLTKKDPIKTHQWHQHTMTFDGDQWIYYVDGRIVAEQAMETGFYPNLNNEPVLIGNESTIYNRGFEGAIDELRIYDYARSAEQVKNEYEELLPDPSQANLVSYFSFDGDAVDLQMTGLKGAVKGPIFRDAKNGKGLYLLGRSEYVEIPYKDELKLDGHSIEMWFNVKQFKNDNYLYSRGGPGNENYDLKVGPRGELSGFMKFEDGVRHWFRTKSGTVTVGQWHHVVQSFDNNMYRIFIDGKIVYEKILFGKKVPHKNTGSLMVGKKHINNSSSFDGYLDELRIYNRGLEPAEVAGLFEGTLSKAKSNTEKRMVAKWSFEKNLKDSSPAGNHGYSHVADYKEGYKGMGVLFQDRNDNIRINDSNTLDLEEFTVAFWTKQMTYRNGKVIFVKGTDTNANYMMATRYDGGLSGTISFADGQTYSLRTKNGVLKPNTWHHVTMSYKSGEWRIYRDGELIAEKTEYTGKPQVNAKYMYIGNSSPLQYDHYSGVIDEMGIYNYALTREQILELMDDEVGEKIMEEKAVTTPLGTEVLSNPGFENGLKEWTSGGQKNEEVKDTLTGDVAIKMHHESGTANALYQELGELLKGETYKVSYAFKAPSGVKAQLFFGDKAGPDPLDNTQTVYKEGNSGWQRIELQHTMVHDDSMGVYIYLAPVDGTIGDYMIIDDVQLEKVQ